MNHTQRRLLWHGMILVLIGLLTGISLQSFTTPRLGLSAHVGGIMNGTLVIVIGAVWSHFVLSMRAAALLFWSTVYSGYANWAGLFLAAAFGTSATTPMHGAGHAGEPWQEVLVGFFLMSGAVFVVVACVLSLAGLRRVPGRVSSALSAD